MTAFSPGPWRVGRKVGRTIYDAHDRLIGVMDTQDDALIAIAAPRLAADLAAAVALLKRAADRLVVHQDETNLIEDVGAFLARVAP